MPARAAGVVLAEGSRDTLPRYVRGYCAVDKSQPRKQPERAKWYKVRYSTTYGTYGMPVPVALGRGAGAAHTQVPSAIVRVHRRAAQPEGPQ